MRRGVPGERNGTRAGGPTGCSVLNAVSIRTGSVRSKEQIPSDAPRRNHSRPDRGPEWDRDRFRDRDRVFVASESIDPPRPGGGHPLVGLRHLLCVDPQTRRVPVAGSVGEPSSRGRAPAGGLEGVLESIARTLDWDASPLAVAPGARQGILGGVDRPLSLHPGRGLGPFGRIPADGW